MFQWGDPEDRNPARQRPHFHWRAVEDVEASAARGVRVFKDVVYVKIRPPEDPYSLVDERLQERHKRQFPREWAAFQAAEQAGIEGVPLAEFTVLRPAELATLKAAGIYTVEALAEAEDAVLELLGPAFVGLRDRARQFLKPAAEVEVELRSKVDEQAREIAGLKSRLAQLVSSEQAAA